MYSDIHFSDILWVGDAAKKMKEYGSLKYLVFQYPYFSLFKDLNPMLIECEVEIIETENEMKQLLNEKEGKQ